MIICGKGDVPEMLCFLIYNRLSAHALDAKTPKQFKHRLHKLAKDAAKSNTEGWQLMFHAS